LSRPTDTAAPLLFTRVPSPIGPLLLTKRAGADRGLLGLFTDAQGGQAETEGASEDGDAFAREAAALAAYFEGTRRAFDLPLDREQGTAFQRAVWGALEAIPFGATTTYGGVAGTLGAPAAVRAVGGAIGKNPWGIIVPCHRVVGTNGALTGFAGGLARKRWLLEHEGLRVDGGRGADDPTAKVDARQLSLLGRTPSGH
jgi:methylated-DNA-[protein]-cysteine S-methyltransferase